MDLSTFEPFLKALGVQPEWYPAMIALGIVNQYGKGMLRFWTEEVSFGLAALAGVSSLVVGIVSHMSPGPGAIRAVVLMAACLITESAINAVAAKVPFIPQNNEWAKHEDPKP